MRVFVTGATGFVGSVVGAELIAHGHEVLGLARSETGAAALEAMGAKAHRGSLEDLDSLKAGARAADAVIHLAFNHDFSTYQANCEDDRRVIEALAEALTGTARPLLVTSGTGMGMGAGGPGTPVTEDDRPVSSAIMPRAASEEAADAAVKAGVNASVVRLPQVHDTGRQGLVSSAIEIALEKGVLAYVGDGAGRWPAAHKSDVARLYRLALENAEAGARWHAVAEEGVPLRAICEALGPRLGLPVRPITPEEAPAHFGWLAAFTMLDLPASSAKTRARLGWTPAGPGLIQDLERLQRPA